MTAIKEETSKNAHPPILPRTLPGKVIRYLVNVIEIRILYLLDIRIR